MTGGPRRVGVVFPGDPAQPSTWSGTPSGVINGLREAGAEPVAINAQPRSRFARELTLNAVALGYLRRGEGPRQIVSRARHAARAAPATGRVESLAAHRSVRGAGPLDGIIQIGTGYALRGTGVPIASFEDMTVRQVTAYPYAGWELLSARAVQARVRVQRRAYERAAACCLTSEWAAESVIGDYGVPRSKVHVVGVGRNHEVAIAGERDWSTPRFLFIGMDWQRKNGDGVIRAFGRLREEFPGARLDLVGAHPPLRAPGVTGHGALRLDQPEEHAQLVRLLGQSTCFVMPSHVEAAGIAYVEAAAAGIPSIGTTEGGSEFLIGDGGLVVNPADGDALLAAMRRLSDPGTAAEMGAAARRRSELFTWTAVARRLLHALSGAPQATAAFERCS